MALKDLCEQLAATIADYRVGEIDQPDAAHVGKWIEQFPGDVREPLLAEVTHVLGQTYMTKKKVKRFLDGVVGNTDVAGDDPATFWRGVAFLDLQQKGNSQRDMLALFDKSLGKVCGIGLGDCGKKPHTYVYLDDGVFSGGRVKGDLVRWIEEDAPIKAKVAVIVMAIHPLGEFFAGKDIAAAAREAGKEIEVNWWRKTTLEDRKTYMAQSDVLRPTAIPKEAMAYVASLGADPILRAGNSVGDLKLFSSPAARELLEQEFLKAGVRVRDMCPNFNAYMRPLGCSLMKTTGFGTMFVTYRNIANNTPLVLWAGNPWYPLFERSTN